MVARPMTPILMPDLRVKSQESFCLGRKSLSPPADFRLAARL